MPKILRQICFNLKIIWVSPLLIAFLLTNQQKIIRQDIDRWEDCLSWSKRSPLKQLLALLQEAQEFRNLYYYRLFKGNRAGKLAMFCLKIFYPPCPYLFLDLSCEIGPGLFIQHGFSTIIMAELGANCWINQQVTIGYKDKTGRPKIGDNVRITAGAKVLGDIKIGNNVTVGANAVVVKDVPDDCVVVGIPAYILKRNGITVKEKL